MTDIYDLAGEPRPKFCRDCKHLARSLQGPENWKCMAPQNIYSRGDDLVTGEVLIKRVFLTCYDARLEGGPELESCGLTARWFEPAPPRLEDKPILTRLPGRGSAESAADLLSQLDKL